MAHKPDSERTMSIKAKLLLIAIMFVAINLIFYFVFDSSSEQNESENSIELDDSNPLTNEKSAESEREMTISVNP